MGGTQKAPPRLSPRPLPRAYRVYAQVRVFDVACPACGTVNVAQGVVGRRKHVQGTRPKAGYDAITGILTCRGCQRPWYVGVVLWGLKPGAVRARPDDHVPRPEEAEQLRGWGKTEDRDRQGGRAGGINLVCWCGAECPAHPKEEANVIDG